MHKVRSGEMREEMGESREDTHRKNSSAPGEVRREDTPRKNASAPGEARIEEAYLHSPHDSHIAIVYRSTCERIR